MSVLILAILSLGAGCAPLPDVSTLAGEAQAQKPPKILSAKGMLSRQKSREIMKRLQGSAHPGDLLERHNAVLEMVSGLPLTKGNKVRLLIDGGSTYAAMFSAMECARESIDIETFKIENDEIGRRFAEALLKKQAEGVQVNLMYDSIGSLATPPSFFKRLRDAGIRVVEVNPLHGKPGKELLPVHADHRKLLVVDGRLAITGGINISQVYASTPFGSEKAPKPPVPWRDTDVEIEGPAAAEFQRLFADLWAQQKGEPLRGGRYFPRLENRGTDLVRAIGSSPGESNRATYISYLCAILFSRHSVHLTNAYFIPDDHTLDALTDAARRGVDVRIILPSISDSSMALYAMRYNYSELLKAGVKLYQRRKALLHSKTAVIDGVWSTVGSTNMDLFSLSKNYEINAVVLSRDFASQMERMFANDLSESEEITLAKWEKRSVLERMRELFAHMLSPLM
jgi:cardiolipin synthase A/B